MYHKNQLIVWIVVLIAIGSAISGLTKPEMTNWYKVLQRSPLTPPNYVFPVVWTVLYGLLGWCAWLIWSSAPAGDFTMLKILYLMHMGLNWSWAPCFFHYHWIGVALLILVVMDVLVGIMIYLTYPMLRAAALLLLPYWGWILFATYLNLYIWLHN